MKWIYNKKPINKHSDLPDNTTHIVYRLTHTDGTMYFGYKTVRSELTVPATKTEIKNEAEGLFARHILRNEDGKIATSKKDRLRLRGLGFKAKREWYKTVYTDLPFLNYTGSSKENKDKIVLYKDILYCTSNKYTATYLESKLLFSFGCIESDSVYTNANISGRYFDNCLDGLIKEDI